jgi:hypothetical protein
VSVSIVARRHDVNSNQLFTEGFDTADMKAAKALIDTLL